MPATGSRPALRAIVGLIGRRGGARLGAIPALALLSTLQGPPDLEVFVREGCPHCAHAKEFLARIAAERPELRIQYVDVERDSAGRPRLIRLAEEQGLTPIGVPTFYVAGQLIIGFESAETTGRRLLALLPRPPTSASARPVIAPPADVVEAPVLGPVSARELGLPLFTIIVGLVDGFNPCAMWALLYILALLVNLKSRTRMFAIGGTFVAVAGIVYFAFLAAWLEVFLLIGFSRIVQATLGGVAVVVGAVNLKEAVAFRKAFSLSIPDAAKPGVYAWMRRVLTAENLAGALVAVAILSVLVNLVELLCTAGLPAVYTEILSAQGLSRPAYYGYLGLYIGAYVFDDSIMLAIAIVTLSRRRLRERGGRWLKLLSGVAMLLLGLTLLIRPEWVA